MTKRSMASWFIGAVIYFVGLVTVGIVVSIYDGTDRRVLFTTFKDLIPLLIAIPAAWLTYCFQRRSAYLQQLRSLWSKLIEAVQTALLYTQSSKPTRDEHLATLCKISIVIEEVRGLFKNLDVSDSNERGLYPFEPIKDIHGLIAELGYDHTFKAQDALATREKIQALWTDVRRELLKEFDRDVPTFPHSHWRDLANCPVYEHHKIEKKPT